jgi:hypothetical protein
MKTEYRIIKIGIYNFLQHLTIHKFIFFSWIRWNFIPYHDNPSYSPIRHNKYICDNNSNIYKFVNDYRNIDQYLQADYPVLKSQSINEHNEFKKKNNHTLIFKTMKNKILFITIISTLMLSACKKDNQQPNNGNGTSGGNNPASTTGTLYFKNTQVDPYTIYLDGTNIGVLASGATTQGYTVTSGISHSVKAEQYSGYVFYPDVYTGTATLSTGGSVTWSF